MASMIGFRPDGTITETIEYKTDVIQTFSREQRIQLRERPHVTLAYDYVLSSQSYANLVYLLGDDPSQDLDIPDWTFYGRSNDSSPDSRILDISNVIFGQAPVSFCLWKTNEETNRVEATSRINQLRYQLSEPIGLDASSLYVAKLERGRLLKGITAEVMPSANVKVRAEYSLGHTSYQYSDRDLHKVEGKALITETPYSFADSNVTILREVDSYSNGILNEFITPKTGWHINRRSVGFKFNGYAGKILGRQLAHYFRGRRRSFWLPNWSQPIKLNDVSTPRDNIITTGWISTAQRLIGKYIFVKMRGCGEQFDINKVNGVTPNGNGGFLLTMEKNNFYQMHEGNTLIVCPVDLCRLESDTITATHLVGDEMRLTLNVVNCPN